MSSICCKSVILYGQIDSSQIFSHQSVKNLGQMDSGSIRQPVQVSILLRSIRRVTQIFLCRLVSKLGQIDFEYTTS